MYRWANSRDYDALGQLMFESIHAAPSPYSAAQRHAWMSEPPGGPEWHRRLSAERVALAEAERPLAFAALRADGYIDLVFISRWARRQGHFRTLLYMLFDEARDQKMPELTTHASIAAQGPFSALGFDLVHHEDVTRAGQTLSRAFMRRSGLVLPPQFAKQGKPMPEAS